MRHFTFFLVFSTLSVISFPAFAQNFPQGDQASVIQEKIRRESEKKLERRRVKTEIEEKQQVEEAPAAAGPAFLVSEVKLEGNTWISRAELGPVIEPYLNQKLTMNDLKKLTQAIENEYRRRGFIANYVYVPPQKIEGGAVLINVIEGKLGEARVEGNRWFRKSRILEYSKLKKGEVIRYEKLWDSLYAMNQNPDRGVRAILQKGKEPGTTDIIFNTKDRFPLHGGFLYDDEGNRPTGLNRIGFSVRDNNLLSMDDVLYTGTIFGSDFGVFYTQYLIPIPQTGTQIIGGYSYSKVAPKKEFKDFGIMGVSQTYYVKVQQALLAGTLSGFSYRLGAEIGFEFKDSRTNMFSEPFRKDRIRVLRFGPTLQVADNWGVTDFINSFAFGINGLGANIYASEFAARQGVEPNFFYYRTGFTRNQKMPYDTRLDLKAQFQIPSDKLPASEAFYLGGASTVRGYPEGDYLSDAGVLLNFDYLIPSFFIPHDWKLPYSDQPLWKQIEIVAFFDYGYGWLHGHSEREIGSRNLMGVGGGFRVRVYQNMFFRAEWGQPIGDAPLSDGARNHFHFRLQAEI